MGYSDDGNNAYPEQSPNPRPNPRPGPTETAAPTGWLVALNSFLERAFLKADVDTGC